MGMNRCRGCDLIFGSVGAFDMHRTGEYGQAIYEQSKTGKKSPMVVGYTQPTRRCLTIAEMTQLDMRQNDKGWWITGQSFDFFDS